MICNYILHYTIIYMYIISNLLKYHFILLESKKLIFFCYNKEFYHIPKNNNRFLKMTDPKITIITKDNKKYDIKVKHLQNCGTLKALVDDINYENEDDAMNNDFPISVDSKEWEICQDYLAQVDVNYSKEFVRILCPDWLYSESVYDDSGKEIHKQYSYKKLDAEHLRKFPVNGDELTWRDKYFKGYNTPDLTGVEKEERMNTQRQMIQVLLAANYLDIEGLIILICRSIGHEINTHDVVKIRELFDGNHNMMGFENDLTEEEINEIEKENDFMKFLSTESEESF